MSINRHERTSSKSSRSNSTGGNGQQTNQQINPQESGSNYSGSTSSLNSFGGSAAYLNHYGSNHHLQQGASTVGQWTTPPGHNHQQNSIPSNAIRTPATSIHHSSSNRHVRSRSAVEPLISYGLLGPPPHNLHSSSTSITTTSTPLGVSNNHLHHLPYHNNHNHHLSKNAVTSLINSSSSVGSPSNGRGSLSPFLSSIEEKVARLYYRHGLFCARHSLAVIAVSLLIVTLAAFPIVTFLGLFGSSSEVYVIPSYSSNRPYHDHFDETTLKAAYSHRHAEKAEKNGGSSPVKSNSLLLQTETDSFLRHIYFWKNYPDPGRAKPASEEESSSTASPIYQNVPRWFQPNLSYAFVQQIYIRSAVIPWTSDLQLVDALRGPLDVLFELIESISNYQLPSNETNANPVSLADLCLQVFEPSLAARYRHLSAHLPSYSCLVLSPANVWAAGSSNGGGFREDTDFLSTLLHYQDSTASPLPAGTLHDLFFGVHFEETGIRRAYGRNRQRTLTYAITLAFKRYSPAYVDGLRDFLLARYPLSKVYYDLEGSSSTGSSTSTANNHSGHQDDEEEEVYHASNETAHVFYQNTFTLAYLVPLSLFYASVCLYMYFTVRKIEIVRNRLLFPAGALLTVLMSVFMSFGICFRLNFNSVLTVNRLLPYFVGFISFENMLVLSKSFLTQYPHLDTKVRVAQGLSLDGLGITKNLMAELTLLMFGSLLFSPFFQECCIFAAICLVSDYLIQVTFFTAFISMNISPINERSMLKKNKDHLMGNGVGKLPKNIYAQPGKPELKKTPKRVRIIYFFARIRIVQRLFILLLCACIGLAIYNAYLVLDQAPTDDNLTTMHSNATTKGFKSKAFNGSVPPAVETVKKTVSRPPKQGNEVDDNHSLIELLKSSSASHEDSVNLSEESKESMSSSTSQFTKTSSKPVSPFARIRFSCEHPVPASMPAHHWSNLFTLYNVSLTGRFLTVLPPILLSIPVTPERARAIRNVADADDEMLLKFVPTKFSNGEKVVVDDDFDEYEQNRPVHFFSHWTRTDAYIIAGLAVPSSLFLLYAFVLMYRCVCTRNYAEWRSQWWFSSTRSASVSSSSSSSSSLSSTSSYRRRLRKFSLWNYLSSFILKRQTGSYSPLGGEAEELEQLLHFDVHQLADNENAEVYRNEAQYLLNHQDIDQIAACSGNSLVACSSMSGDIRVYDALTCENLSYIKRSKTVVNRSSSTSSGGDGHSPTGDNASSSQIMLSPTQTNSLLRHRLNSTSTPISNSSSSALVARTSGNFLKTIIDGISVEDCHDEDEVSEDLLNNENNGSPLGNLPFQPVWCLDIFDRYILAGCGGGDGRLEVWDGHTGQLAYVHPADHHDLSSEDGQQQGASITAMRVTFWGVALARINGTLDLLEADQRKDVKYCLPGNNTSSAKPTAVKGHRMASSSGGSLVETQFSIKFRLRQTIQAHQQPITRMEIIDSLEDEDFIKAFGSRGCLITGSLDNTLKVFSLDQAKFVYTLNGHCGGISTTSIDQYSTATALSGCQLGQLFVWDLNTGTCIFSMQAHAEAEVLAITASQLYYVSSGTDCRICIWDRYSGHLVHQMNQQHSHCRNMMFLEAHILITVRDYELVVWDVNDARQMCIVSLANASGPSQQANKALLNSSEEAALGALERRRSGSANTNHHHRHHSNFEQSMIRTYQTAAIQRLCFAVQQKVLLCDYGNTLCVISNPFAAKKLD